MALSGTITGTTNNEYISSKIVWSATQDTSGNYSTVTAALSYSRTNSGYTTYGTWSGSITINGTKTNGSKSVTITQNSNTVAMTATVKVPHNADGSKTITISAAGGIPDTSFTSTSLSKSVTLNTIPRASTISATAGTIGTNPCTITINRASSSFTHTLTYTFGDLSGTIATKTSNTTVKWTLPTSFYAQMPNSTSKSGTITCTTYSGNTSVGTKTAKFTAYTTKSLCAPTLAPVIKDTGSVSVTLTGDANNKVIKDYNNMSITTGAAARNSATLKSQKVTCGGKSITTATGSLGYVSSGDFVVTATDSRGYTTTQTVKKTLIDYVKVTCTLSAQMPDTSGNMSFTVKGNYFNGSFGAVDNSLTVEYRMKTGSGSYGAWTALTATKSGNTYTAKGNLSGLDYQTSYTIQARAIDEIATATSAEKVVKTTPVFDWGENDFNFNVDVKSQQNYIFRNGGVGIHGTTTDGVELQVLQPCNSNNNLSLGYGGYTNSIGATNLYGNEVKLISNGSVYVNSRKIAENNVLWSGALYMTAGHTITLKEKVSQQAHGIVLVFSLYSDGEQNMNFSEHFVSRYVVGAHSGSTVNHDFHMGSANHGFFASKTLYISDTEIKGSAANNASGTGADGIKYTNNAMVLRYVIGV